MRKAILLTGAGGFIGRRLSVYLEDKYDVFKITRSLDLRKTDSVRLYFEDWRKKNRIYGIIHLASRMHSAEGADDTGILRDNIRISESIACIAKMLKPRKIINFSSMAVYPNKDGVYRETSQTAMSANTDCLYGLSKFCAENILDFMLRNEKIIISHLRISQVYADDMRQDRTMPVMLEELKTKNTITVFGSGRRVSDFVHVDKLLPVVDLFIKNDHSGVFNIGGESLSYLAVARRIVARYGDKKSRIIIKPQGCAARFRLDTAKIKGIQNG